MNYEHAGRQGLQTTIQKRAKVNVLSIFCLHKLTILLASRNY